MEEEVPDIKREETIDEADLEELELEILEVTETVAETTVKRLRGPVNIGDNSFMEGFVHPKYRYNIKDDMLKHGDLEGKKSFIVDHHTIIFIRPSNLARADELINNLLDHMYGKRRNSEESIRVIDDTQGEGNSST